MAEIAKVVRIERYGNRVARFLVDGKELPFALDATVQTVVGEDYVPGVTVMIPAETVEIVHSVESPPEEDRRKRAMEYLNSKSPAARGR